MQLSAISIILMVVVWVELCSGAVMERVHDRQIRQAGSSTSSGGPVVLEGSGTVTKDKFDSIHAAEGGRNLKNTNGGSGGGDRRASGDKGFVKPDDGQKSLLLSHENVSDFATFSPPNRRHQITPISKINATKASATSRNTTNSTTINTISTSPYLTIADTGNEYNVGNLIYSAWGFILGGLLTYLSLSPTFREPFIQVVDSWIGSHNRRRRNVKEDGFEAYVSVVFTTLTNAVDRITAISDRINKL